MEEAVFLLSLQLQNAKTELEQERIKAKALIEALEEIKDRKFCHCAEMAELAIKEYNKNNP